jgi:hypothetical protein
VIHELVGLHGHLVDEGEFTRFHELFTPNVVYDLRDYGGVELHGIEAIVQASRALGDANPDANGWRIARRRVSPRRRPLSR